jgi:zinc protease
MRQTAKTYSMLLFSLNMVFSLSLLPRAAPAMPSVQRLVLPNQLILLVSEEHSIPSVSVEVLINAGSWRDPPGEEGLASLTAKGLLLGTSTRSATALQEELDFMGASLSAVAQRDYATLSLQVLKKDLDRGLELLMEVLTQPIFPDEEVHREVEKTLAAVQADEDQPEEVAEKAFQQALFPANPYGHPVEGTPASIAKLRRDAIVRFYQSYYHANHVILAVVGDSSLEEVQPKLSAQLSAWPMGDIPAATPSSAFASGPQTISIDREQTQAHIILGHIGISRDNPDFEALSVMNYILGGGGFASRLVQEIRDKRGLAYSVASGFDAGKFPGAFQIVLQTKNTSAQEAISLALQQLARLRTELVPAGELEAARKALIGSFPRRLATQVQLATFLTRAEYYGLGLDYPAQYPTLIASITSQDVRRVAQTYLHPQQSICVIVANVREAGIQEPSKEPSRAKTGCE